MGVGLGERLLGEVPGHDLHLTFSVSSNGEQLVHMADLVLHPLLMERPDWVSGFDVDLDQTTTTRRSVLPQLAGPGTLSLGYHLPASPALGYVQERKTGWGWDPIEALARPP